MSRSNAPVPLASASPAGVRLLAVFGACTVVGALVAAVGVPHDNAYLTFVLIVVLAALGAPLAVAAGCAGLAWAVFTGFVANDVGVLTASAEDLTRLALLVGAALLSAWSSDAHPAQDRRGGPHRS